MSLKNQFLGVSRKLKGQFDRSIDIPHDGERGESREKSIVKDFLEEYLPKRFSIGTGHVFDTTNNSSLQQDIVIYDAFNCPTIFQDESTSLYPCESVYAVIEVKSTLNTTELRDGLSKVESVKQLIKNPLPLQLGPGISTSGVQQTFGAVFAFTNSTSIRTLRRNLSKMQREIPRNHWINTVGVLDVSTITYVDPEENNIVNHPADDFVLASWETGEDSLLLFYLLLMDHLNRSVATPPNMMAYARSNLSYPSEWDS